MKHGRRQTALIYTVLAIAWSKKGQSFGFHPRQIGDEQIGRAAARLYQLVVQHPRIIDFAQIGMRSRVQTDLGTGRR